jgi:hypothetical protein
MWPCMKEGPFKKMPSILRMKTCLLTKYNVHVHVIRCIEQRTHLLYIFNVCFRTKYMRLLLGSSPSPSAGKRRNDKRYIYQVLPVAKTLKHSRINPMYKNTCYCPFNTIVCSVLSSFLASWVMNGGYTTIYYKWGQYGLLWALLEWPILFLSTVRSLQHFIDFLYVYL